MRKLLITAAGAALLTAGVASAAEVQVIEAPDSNVTVYVTTFDQVPPVGNDDAGMLSADIVGAPDPLTDPALLFDGVITDPDVMLYIYDEDDGTRVTNVPIVID